MVQLQDARAIPRESLCKRQVLLRTNYFFTLKLSLQNAQVIVRESVREIMFPERRSRNMNTERTAGLRDSASEKYSRPAIILVHGSTQAIY